MARRLAHAVHVEHPATGERVVLLPGAEVSPDLADLITHPAAWHPSPDRDEAEQAEPDDDPQPVKPTRARKAHTDTE